MDAEHGELVSIDGSSDTSSALIIDSNGLFVVTMPALIKITGQDMETILHEIQREVEALAKTSVPECGIHQFSKDLNNIINRVWKRNSQLNRR